MTYEDFVETVRKITFNKLPIRCYTNQDDTCVVRLDIDCEDAVTNKKLAITYTVAIDREELAEMTQLDAIRYVRKVAQGWMLHELDEHFMFKGERLFHPHKEDTR